jgi:hypothetical protein
MASSYESKAEVVTAKKRTIDGPTRGEAVDDDIEIISSRTIPTTDRLVAIELVDITLSRRKELDVLKNRYNLY